MAGVTGGHSHDNTAVSQAFHDGLVLLGGVSGAAGAAGAQGQVHGVSAQNDGVFDSGHVVGVISAALLAEDLHGQQLCVGSNALNEYAGQSGSEAGLAGNEGVGSSDTGNVGTVFALLVIQVGNIVVLVNIVVTEGNLAVDVSLLAGEGGIQFAGDLFDLSGGQQIQGSLVLIGSHTGQTGAVSQRVLKGGSVEGDMVGIRTGIDDGDTGTGAGVAVAPGCGGTGLLAGGGHVGIGSAGGNHVGRIHGLDQDLSNTVDSLDGLDLAVSDVSGNDVGGQGQVPDNVQFLCGSLFDLSGNLFLSSLQVVTVQLSEEVGTGSFCLETSFQSAGLVQNDGHTDDIRIGVGRLLIRHLGHIAGELGGNAAVADFLEADAGLSSQAGNGQGHDQANGEHHRKHFVENRRFFHMYTLLFLGFGLVIRSPYPSKTALSLLQTTKSAYGGY